MILERLLFFLIVAICFTVSNSFASDSDFESEQMLSELEAQLELTHEKLSRLKPAIDAKSSELKKSIHESVDKGFIQLEELTGKLDDVSKDAEDAVRKYLDSEEIQKFREYLGKVDKAAIEEVKDRFVAELVAVLELTEEQVIKLKPLFEDSMSQLSELLDNLARQGSQNLDEFKFQYEKLAGELRKQLEDILNNEQIKKFDRYNEEKKEKIQQVMFSV